MCIAAAGVTLGVVVRDEGERGLDSPVSGRVGQSPDGQLDVVPELPVQFLCGGGGPGLQPDLEGGWRLSSTSGMGYCIRGPGCSSRSRARTTLSSSQTVVPEGYARGGPPCRDAALPDLPQDHRWVLWALAASAGWRRIGPNSAPRR